MSRHRAIAVHQPWAWAICAGLKRVENRTWTTKYRGRLAIHAGISRDRLDAFLEQVGPGAAELSPFPTAAVVGVVELTDVVPLSPELESDPSAIGPYCWLFKDPRLLISPVRATGKTSLFYLDESESARVAAGESFVPDLDDVPELRLRPWELCLARGNSYWELQADADALRCYDAAIQLAPDRSEAHRARGLPGRSSTT